MGKSVINTIKCSVFCVLVYGYLYINHNQLLLFILGKIMCESPNNRLDRFQGNLEWNGDAYSLDNSNVILRVSKYVRIVIL